MWWRSNGSVIEEGNLIHFITDVYVNHQCLFISAMFLLDILVSFRIYILFLLSKEFLIRAVMGWAVMRWALAVGIQASAYRDFSYSFTIYFKIGENCDNIIVLMILRNGF